jgi:hypothetical protein
MQKNWICIRCGGYISPHDNSTGQCKCENPQSRISMKGSGIYREGIIHWGPNQSPKKARGDETRRALMAVPVCFALIVLLVRSTDGACSPQIVLEVILQQVFRLIRMHIGRETRMRHLNIVPGELLLEVKLYLLHIASLPRLLRHRQFWVVVDFVHIVAIDTLYKISTTMKQLAQA